MDDRQRIESITANFFFWQGLRWVPLGLALVILSLFPHSGQLRIALMLAVLTVALVISDRFGRWYARHYGRVVSRPGQHAGRESWKWFFVYPLMMISLLVDAKTKSMFFVSGPIWGAAIVAFWYSTGRGRLHYLAAAAIIAASGFLPVTGVAAPGREMFDAFFALLGGVYVICGILDHLELNRILGRTPEADDAGTV